MTVDGTAVADVAPVVTREVGLGPARVRFTTRADGDMADGDMAGGDTTGDSRTGHAVRAARRRAVVDRPWTWLRQVHGAGVVTVNAPGEGAGAVADGAVSAAPGAALSVLTADCAPVALASPEGVIGVAHAGWRGLLAGVIPETVAAMRALGARRVLAALGPCIHAECYQFGSGELDAMEAALGVAVRASTRDGQPALDLPAAVDASLRRADVELAYDARRCTACSGGYWSWRAGRASQRQATVVWLP